MVTLTDEEQSNLFDVDSDRFTTALTMYSEDEDFAEASEPGCLYMNEPFLAVSASNASTTLHLSQIHKNNPKISTKGILTVMSHCDSIRELSLSYSFLSEELLKALSSDEALHLETLRVEAHPEMKPVTSPSCEAWQAFANHSPNVNLILLSYLTETADYEKLLMAHVPLTHLYFGESAPAAAIDRVGHCCPRLMELVVGSYGPATIDNVLIAAARGCPRLSSVGLGDCELTCSGFIEFVSLCCKRLQVLYVLETSLLEDPQHNIMDVSAKVSSLLGKSWQPNYVPYW